MLWNKHLCWFFLIILSDTRLSILHIASQAHKVTIFWLIEKNKTFWEKEQVEKHSTSRNISLQLQSNGNQVICKYDRALNSPCIPAWKAGRNAACAGTPRHSVISGPSWPLENHRGSSQLPVTVAEGNLDSSLTGQTRKDFFFLQSLCQPHTRAQRAGASPLLAPAEAALCLQADGVYSTLQGLPVQSKELRGFAG